MVLPQGRHTRPEAPARVAEVATDAAARLLALDPVLGDHATQVAVDTFVERAAQALLVVASAGAADGIPGDSGSAASKEPR